MNAAVDVRFGRKIDDGARLMLRKKFGGQFEIADIALNEQVAGIALQRGEVLEITSLGERVEVDDRFIGLGQPVEDEIAADEARCASDQNHLFAPPAKRG